MRSFLKGVLACAALAASTPALADVTTSPVVGASGASFGKYGSQTLTTTVPTSGTVSRVQVDMNMFTMNNFSDGARITITHNGKSVVILDTDKCVNTQNKLSVADDAGTSYSSLKRTTCQGAATYWRPPPPQVLAAFNGMDMAGDWTLTVTDVSNSNGGYISGFSVRITYDVADWVPGQWSAYSNTCGSATRTRTIACMLNGTTVADSQCTKTKPDVTETSYQTSGCGYDWTPSAWTPVYKPNYGCGATTRTRTATCTRSDNTTVADSFCPAASKPTTSEPYDDPKKCDFRWNVGAWTDPAQTCGDGTRTRSVSCIDASSGYSALTEGMCTDTTMGGQGPKPATSEAVATYTSCQYGWYRTGFSLGSCINGRQTYRAYYKCFRDTGVPVTQFCGGTPPSRVSTQSCGYWASNLNQTWNDVAPGYSLSQSQYSTSGVNNGDGYLSKGADGVSGSTGYGNAGVPAGGSSTTLPQRTGGTYDVDSDIYTVSPSARYTGGNYSTATGTYDGGTLMDAQPTPTPTPTSGTDPSDTGRNIVMRRPIPGAGR